MPLVILIIAALVTAPVTIPKMEQYNKNHEAEYQAQSFKEAEASYDKQYEQEARASYLSERPYKLGVVWPKGFSKGQLERAYRTHRAVETKE